MKCMLEHGASVNTRTRTPLMVAILNFGRENRADADMQLIIQALIAADANPNAVDEDGDTALTMALLSHGRTADQIRKDNVPASVCILLIEAGE